MTDILAAPAGAKPIPRDAKVSILREDAVRIVSDLVKLEKRARAMGLPKEADKIDRIAGRLFNWMRNAE